jgi:hypothetical protein
VAIDAAAVASKNLYNAALYLTRQAFIHQSRVIHYEELAREMKAAEAYRALPAKVAQWVVRQVALAWKSYCAACRAWEADPSRFLGHPKRPKYLDKRGRNLLTYTEQANRRTGEQANRRSGAHPAIVAMSRHPGWLFVLKPARRLSTRCGSCRTRRTTLWR